MTRTRRMILRLIAGIALALPLAGGALAASSDSSPVLARIAARVRYPFPLGRVPGNMRIRSAEGYFGSGQASIPGRLVLDGMDLVRGAFLRFDDMSLDAVSREVLGEGKALEGDVKDRAGEIMARYEEDLEGFAFYARTDSRLALEVVNRLNLVDLAVASAQPARSRRVLLLSDGVDTRGQLAPLLQSVCVDGAHAYQAAHFHEADE